MTMNSMNQAMTRTRFACRVLPRRCGLALILTLMTAAAARAQVAVISPTLVERSVRPGEVYQDSINIHNSSGVAQIVSLTLADYRFQADGETEFAAPNTLPRSNAAWIALSQPRLTVLPKQDVTVPYTVHVPADASTVGTYWSVVLVEAERAASGASVPSGFSVTPRLRYAVQLAMHAGASGEPLLVFGEPALSRTGFTAQIRTGDGASPMAAAASMDDFLTVDVGDAGTRGCRPTFRLEVYQADGTLVHSATVSRGLLYPGTSIRQRFGLPRLPAGDYLVLLLADVGRDAVQATKFQVRVP